MTDKRAPEGALHRFLESSAATDDEVNQGGAVFFGFIVGVMTAATFFSADQHGVKDLASIVGIIGGAGITRLYGKKGGPLGFYSTGLFFGFLPTMIIYLLKGP